jgi:hypothetical protein
MALVGGATKAPAKKGPAGQKPQIVVPYIRASHDYQGDVFFDQTFTPVSGKASKLTPQPQVPMYGFLYDVVIKVEGSGGDIDGGTVTKDFPFNILDSIGYTFPNGKEIVYPLPGFQAYLLNAFGGYAWSADPAAQPDYDGSYASPNFQLRLPAVITGWDQFGALSNQNSGSLYKVAGRLSDPDTWQSGGGGGLTPPDVRVTMLIEAGSAPLPQDMLGQPQQTRPPGLGTVQYWSVEDINVNAHSSIGPRTQRTGNLVRNWLWEFKDDNGVRSDNNIPDPVTLLWDTAPIWNAVPLSYLKDWAFERYGYALPDGVLAYPRTFDAQGHAGFENRHQWLPTLETSRINLNGDFPVQGTVSWLTNDVAITPAGR